MIFRPRFHLVLAAMTLAAIPRPALAEIFSDADARSAALGGTSAAQSDNVLAAMQTNPAALTSLPRAQAAVTLTAALLRGDFQQPSRSAHLRNEEAFLGAGALEVAPPNNWPVRFGLASFPDLTLESDWRYLDRPGGLGGTASYGNRTQAARILSLRTMASVAIECAPWLSLGASAGFVYNQNALHAPYVFQSQPVLRGFKTLLDLETDGYAPAFDFGAQWRPSPKITVGLAYRPASVIHSTGRATGNALAQLQALGGGFAHVNPNLSYDAEVRVELPPQVRAALEWQVLDRLRVVAGIDWIGWAGAFDDLDIHLSHGSNAAINGVVGSNELTDTAPLRWRDQLIYRAGLELAVCDSLTARAGYSYGRSPVPHETLTPLTGAIFEHTVAAGLGYHTGRYFADMAWQWRLPATQRVAQSTLEGGEYSHTALTVSAHLFQLTLGAEF